MSLADFVGIPKDRPPIITITGDAGTGKTTLANTFVKPIFILAEDGVSAIPHSERPPCFPVVKSGNDIFEQLKMLCTEKHDYKTVVIDSVTQAETFFIEDVIKSDFKKPKSINQALGGFGNGRQAVADKHGRIRKAAQILNEMGMCVVFVAHSNVSTIELPDEDAYSRYELRLMKYSQSHYVDNVDLVAYLKMETFTKGEGERKQAVSTGRRIILCGSAASQVSKNRYGITEPLVFEQHVNPFTNHINFFKES